MHPFITDVMLEQKQTSILLTACFHIWTWRKTRKIYLVTTCQIKMHTWFCSDFSPLSQNFVNIGSGNSQFTNAES